VKTAKNLSSHNKWTLENHHSQLLEGLDFRVCCSASAQTRTAASKTTGKCSLWDDGWSTSR